EGRCAAQQNWPPDVRVGSFSGITAVQQQRLLHFNKQTLRPPTLVYSVRWKNYSITSSATASTPDGIVRPSAFAVLRLITNSNLVGACTGRSPGRSPFMMRSM